MYNRVGKITCKWYVDIKILFQVIGKFNAIRFQVMSCMAGRKTEDHLRDPQPSIYCFLSNSLKN
jgi:hypothetical protein